MGDLIAFRSRDRTLRSQIEHPTSTESARILLVTGVRYDRCESPVVGSVAVDSRPGPDSIGGTGGGKKRKRG